MITTQYELCEKTEDLFCWWRPCNKKSKEFQPKHDETLTDASAIYYQEKQMGSKGICLCLLKVFWILNKYELGAYMNQARKSDFKTCVKKKNWNSKRDSSHKTFYSILYWKLVFKPFPNESFGWCNAHSVHNSSLRDIFQVSNEKHTTKSILPC